MTVSARAEMTDIKCPSNRLLVVLANDLVRLPALDDTLRLMQHWKLAQTPWVLEHSIHRTTRLLHSCQLVTFFLRVYLYP